MTEFWMGLLTHFGAAVAGAMIARNPERTRAALAWVGAWIAARLPAKSDPAKGS